MNFTTYSVLGSSIVLRNSELTTSVDPFYIGIGIGLSGGVLTCIVIAHYLYHKRQNRLRDTQVVFEEHNNVDELSV